MYPTPSHTAAAAAPKPAVKLDIASWLRANPHTPLGYLPHAGRLASISASHPTHTHIFRMNTSPGTFTFAVRSWESDVRCVKRAAKGASTPRPPYANAVTKLYTRATRMYNSGARRETLHGMVCVEEKRPRYLRLTSVPGRSRSRYLRVQSRSACARKPFFGQVVRLGICEHTHARCVYANFGATMQLFRIVRSSRTDSNRNFFLWFSYLKIFSNAN